jgi:hypothetical protein
MPRTDGDVRAASLGINEPRAGEHKPGTVIYTVNR